MINIPQKEKEILKFWQENNIFKKTLEKDSPKGDFVFYDGPPFATGTPHYGHIVASLIKDMVPRYWTMQGYYVERRWGWDCHGLPIENIVEQELNLKSKKDIEDLGIGKFNEVCRTKVLRYAGEWRKVIDRLGRWVDMDNDYKTMDLNFMESVWWVFKQLWDKGLIYEGYKSMHICPRCETTLSQSEVSQGYKDVEDISVIAKFKLSQQPTINKQQASSLDKFKDNIYILAWTTTPWTLPGNVALAVGENIEYVLVESQGEYFILARQNLESIFEGREFKIINKVNVRDLEGARYEPLFGYYLGKDLKNKENLYTVQIADFVTVEDGTGVVHIAPAFGEDDMNLGKEKKLPFIQHVKMDGRFTYDITDFKNEEVKPKNNPQATDKKIIEYLKGKNLVFKTENFVHSYPHCWRCDSPLLNYATSSWFVKVTALKDEMLKSAQNINWVPGHLKKGRFGKWLEGAKDWSISRQRFWGSVMPIWQCQGNKQQTTNNKQQEGCDNVIVIGSVKELEKLSGRKIDDLHKHFVDKITFKCDKCGGVMRRVPDVLDCWFESGSMPYAQIHYPFENKEKFEKNFPAQFIAEGVDQTRCWFYYLHVLSTALKKSEAFKNVVANGIVLAEDGKKMSKRLQNYPEPEEVFNKYGADAVRYYLATSPVVKADDLCFSEKGVDEVVKKVLLILLNVLSFYQMYADEKLEIKKLEIKEDTNVLDRWIISKLEQLKKEITDAYNNYDLVEATRPLAGFINDLSTWYLRRSRGRFKGDDEKDKIDALRTLRYVLLELSKLMAPVMPFMAEHIYKELDGDKESVHLEDWPEVKKDLIDQRVLDYMEITRKIVELALAKRAEAGIKVRQPLRKLTINNQQLTKEYADLIKDEVNVKEIIQKQGAGELQVELDIEITDELKQEGYLRELVRLINAKRKKMGLTVKDRVKIEYETQDETLASVFEKYKDELLKLTLADELVRVDKGLEKVKVNGIEAGLKIKS